MIKEIFQHDGRVWMPLLLAPALMVLAAGCSTFTNYLHIITPHTAADLLADNVQVFEGRSYDEVAVLAAEAGYEVILSYEGRGRQGLFNTVNASVRLIAQDADGVLPANVQAFEGADYYEAAELAEKAGYEVILFKEEKGSQRGVRIIAKDADGIRPGTEE